MRIATTYKKIYIGIFVAILFVSMMQLSSLASGIISGMERPAKVQVAVPTTAPEEKSIAFTPTRIDIDSVDIHLPVVSVPLKNGTWDVKEKVANYAEETSLVNETEGNVGIFGHDRPDAFRNIKNLLTGYDIMLSNDNYRATYRVDSIDIVEPDQVEVYYPTKEPIVTLITCDGALSEKRFIVKAKLVHIEGKK